METEPNNDNRQKLIELLLDDPLVGELIAKRLLQKATSTIPAANRPVDRNQDVATERTTAMTLAEEGSGVAPAEFAKVEKNLISLGFFTPSSKRIRDAKAKTLVINTKVDGNRIEAKATIVPAALYGLPITADQDKYLALQKLITDLRLRLGGAIANPISFSSAELLHVLQHADAGKNYREIDEWLNVMSSTTIISEGAVWLAGKKRWVKDRFHVFDRAVSFGKELEPGVVADKNYVWLSEWQLENINNNFLMPVDLETYRQLSNHIAKALVPLLQIWLFASQGDGSFEKRYDELCQVLSIRQYFQLSRIKEQLGPSLDELTRHGYLNSWTAQKTSDESGYKIIFRHGDKFHRDRQRRLPRQTPVVAPIGQAQLPARQKLVKVGRVDVVLLEELMKRGIGESGAKQLLAKLPSDRPIRDLLEWGDAEIIRKPGKITNPAGFLIRLLEQHSTPPPTFQSFRPKALRDEAYVASQEVEKQNRARQQGIEQELRRRGQRRLATLTPEQQQERLAQCKAGLLEDNAFLGHQKDSKVFEVTVRSRLVRQLALECMDIIPTELIQRVHRMAGLAQNLGL